MNRILKNMSAWLISLTLVLPSTTLLAEEETTTGTNTDPTLFEQVDELKEELAGFPILTYAGFDAFEKEKEEGTYIIPGLKQTLSLDKKGKASECDEMTPQGIAATDQYILISAYCFKHEHNSVLYVIDKNSHEYVKTIVLDGRPHTGSIAYDKEQNVVWVATKEEEKDRGSLSSIPYAALESYDFSQEKKAIAYNYTSEIPTLKDVSFFSYYKNQLYCGYFSKDEKSVRVYIYDIDPKTGEIDKSKRHMAKAKGVDYIGDNCQGIAVNDQYIFLAASDGPIDNSHLYVFKHSQERLLPKEADDSWILPPRLEQIYFDGEETLLLNFESAAKHYRDEGTIHIDRALSLNIPDLLH